MYRELRVPVQVDDIKLHLRSMSFDLREKKKTGDSFALFKKCELLTASCLSRKVTIEAKTSLELQGLTQGRGFSVSAMNRSWASTVVLAHFVNLQQQEAEGSCASEGAGQRWDAVLNVWNLSQASTCKRMHRVSVGV